MTVVGRDRPGIIADVSGTLAGLGFNLTDTTMTLLRGHFAMTLLCAGGAPAERVREALEPVTAGGLTVTVLPVEGEPPARSPAGATSAGGAGLAAGEDRARPAPAGTGPAGGSRGAPTGTATILYSYPEAPDGVPYVLSVYGADRMGIVAELTRILAEGGGNITDLTTRLSGELYLLVAEVDLGAGTDLPRLRDGIQEAALGLGVEASLRPVDADVL